MDIVDFMETEEYKLGKMTVHGLFTRFNTPVVYDLYIPNEIDNRILMKIFEDSIKGKSRKPEEINCISYPTPQSRALDFSVFEDKLTEKVAKGIESAFKYRGTEDLDHPTRDSHWSVIESTLQDRETFAVEGPMGYGPLYRYRDGKKQEYSEKTQRYFSSVQQKDFDAIAREITPFIGETHKSG